jgi:hypothetical protein
MIYGNPFESFVIYLQPGSARILPHNSVLVRSMTRTIAAITNVASYGPHDIHGNLYEPDDVDAQRGRGIYTSGARMPAKPP